VTVNGQLMLVMLGEQLQKISQLEILQANTDGLTVKLPRHQIGYAEIICNWWERMTCMELECNFYSRLFIRDVNSYIAEYE